ncbi:MAG: hypothetical protein GY787_16445 [Alteromonadales bacterium]|nr:hypothetical protein [Alteromonadales bacterium]
MRFFIFFLLLSPLFASALSGEVIITNITVNHYSETDYGAAVYYKINAKKNIRKISKQIRFFISEETAAEKFYYQEGTLELSKVQLHFKKAYLYNGNLILKGVNGTINGQQCQAENITFLINQRKIKSSKIIFPTADTITIKRQYQYSVNAYLHDEHS